MRILHKRELGCHATQAITLKEGDREAIDNKRDAAFWELLGGKKGVKCECVGGTSHVCVCVCVCVCLYMVTGFYTGFFSWAHVAWERGCTVIVAVVTSNELCHSALLHSLGECPQ